MAKLESLQDLLVQELQDLYNAENQITKALPKMAKAATNADLRSAFEEHLQQTEGQIERLEKAFGLLGEAVKGKRCEGMSGILEEGKEVLEEDAEESVRDAALIGAAQRVEHYEIASYGCVATYAEMLGLEEVAELMRTTLGEEEATDKRLSDLAEAVVNLDAALPEGADPRRVDTSGERKVGRTAGRRQRRSESPSRKD